MSEILPLSVAAQKVKGIVEYYRHELGKEIDWSTAKDHLREDLYHEIDKIAEQGRQHADPE